MNFIEIIGIVIIVLIVVTTFIAEPKLSFDYFRACAKSTGKLYAKAKEMISEWQAKRNSGQEEISENGKEI